MSLSVRNSIYLKITIKSIVDFFHSYLDGKIISSDSCLTKIIIYLFPISRVLKIKKLITIAQEKENISSIIIEISSFFLCLDR